MINNQPEFDSAQPANYDGKFHWDFYRDALTRPSPKWPRGTTCDFMDLDGIYERCGWLLGFETKVPGAPVKTGQGITLNTIRELEAWTIVFCAKQPADVDHWLVFNVYSAKPESYVGNAAALREWIYGWRLRAEARPRPLTAGLLKATTGEFLLRSAMLSLPYDSQRALEILHELHVRMTGRKYPA